MDTARSTTQHPRAAALFRPLEIGALNLPNRLVMPPMGVHTAENGVPGSDVAAYYRRRAEGGVGLIVTEGTYIDHPVSGHSRGYLRMNSEASIAGWTEVVRQVHEAGGLIIPELWHVGLVYLNEDVQAGRFVYDTSLGMVSPSGFIMPDLQVAEPMTERQIAEVIDSFARAAVASRRAGFDGVEIHGAHGYLIDQFFWSRLNRRTDGYGGSMRNRARFGAEVIAEVRRRVGPDCPVSIRLSQWKMQDYTAKVATSPQEMADWLEPLVEAGVDLFDCSQRRFWEPEFEGSPLNFAGWVKKLTGKPSITVGSVGLSTEMAQSLMEGQDAAPVALDPLFEMLERGDFDLVAVGRALIGDPDWPKKVAAGRFDELAGFRPATLAEVSETFAYLKKPAG
jgi:2,4-dienoyl-CoA reductase-like NADH-dependent reductase (Old Yellow Enzyme family)